MRPFADSPYFVANPLQAKALVRLRQAVTFPGGVAVLSGGPGVGKSAFIRQALVPAESDVQLLPVDLRGAEPADLLPGILNGLGASPTDAGSVDLIKPLREALLAQRTSGRQVILALDVSAVTVDLARRLLRLLHLSDEQRTPVSIIIQGPHTLHRLLDAPALIQLRQRLSFRLNVRPLTMLETSGYLRHCLTAAGAGPDQLLGPLSDGAVYLYVAGVPRLVNTLMDAALGELQTRPAGVKLDGELIRQVAGQLGWKPIGTRAPANPVKQPAAPAPTEPPAKRPEASRPPLPVPMDATDTSATGMLRLEDLNERLAETVFSEDSGYFKNLIETAGPR